MSFLLGLTGSIGMGKSTTAQLFVAHGCDLWDADAAVHRLYGKGGAAVARIGSAFPQAIHAGCVDRERLKSIIAADPNALQRIEAIVHPLVAQDRAAFIDASKAEIIVLDIPLLFETGAEETMDAVVCVHVPPEVQRERVLARGTMTAEQFEHILSKQLPSSTKCAMSDFVIETDTREHAEAQVLEVLAEIRERLNHA